MRLLVTSLVGLVACTTPAPPPAVPTTPIIPIAPAPIASPLPDLAPMFAAPAPTPTQERCLVSPAPARAVQRGTIYDFAELPLGAIESGPRTRERERRDDPLTPRELHRPFARRADHITRCWKWFAATHPGRDTTLEVRLPIDVFGATGAIQIMNRPEEADLAACIREGFRTPIHAYSPRPRERTTHATLVFERADQPPWPRPPARPRPPAPEAPPQRGTTCVRVAGDPVAQRLSPLLVSDADASRLPRTRGQLPQIRIGCVNVAVAPDKHDLRGAVLANWGALEACHAAARTRVDPAALAGSVQATIIFGPRGVEPPRASVAGVGDAELHACIARALEEIWLEPATEDSTIEAHFTFPLVTDAPPPARDAAWWRAELARATSPRAGCAVRDALVRDRVRAAPWGDDPRVRAAYRELAEYIARRSPEDAAACLADSAATFTSYTRIVGEHGIAAVARVAGRRDRLEAVLPVAAIAPWGAELRRVLALLYVRDPARVDEGWRMVRDLAADAARGGDVEQVELDERPAPIDDVCAR